MPGRRAREVRPRGSVGRRRASLEVASPLRRFAARRTFSLQGLQERADRVGGVHWLHRRSVGWLAAMACLWMVADACQRGPARRVITSIGQMASLPAQIEDGSYRTQFTGWVTLMDKASNLVFVEDGTGAARVDLVGPSEIFVPGDRVEIAGVVTSGGAAPLIGSAKARRLPGTHELASIATSIADTAAGRTGFRRVELDAELRSVGHDRMGREVLRLGGGGQVIAARINEDDSKDLEGMVGGRIRVRGVANLNRDLYGHIGRVQLWIVSGNNIDLIGVARPAAEMPAQSAAAVTALPLRALPEIMAHVRQPTVQGLHERAAHRGRCRETERRLQPFEHPRQPYEPWCSIRRGIFQ